MTKLVRYLFLFVLIWLFLLGKSGYALAMPNVYTNYYCLMDRASGQVIVSRAADEIRPVASTTKMMTAILAIEYSDLDEIAVVTEHADKTPEYTIGLSEGQKVAVSELLKAALIQSSNDAAVVLAEHVAGDEKFFGHLMSKKAFALGAVNTHFVNASGLPDENHNSTAYDLAVIGRYLLSKDKLNQLVATRQAQFYHPGYQRPLILTNTNGLLGSYQGADGIKTGTTNAAGKCLVASATRGGRSLIAVALKTGDRKGDCARLLDYGFNHCQASSVIHQSIPFKQVRVVNGIKPYVDLYASEHVSLWQGDKTPDIEKKVTVKYIVEAPVVMGQKVGYVEVYANQKLVKTVDLVYGESIPRDGNLIKRLLGEFLTAKRIPDSYTE